ncbi:MULTISPECIES: RsmB/NOP family class I SAM-dependent RNA methyltransferase [Kamptonema]|uniref:RsmB/NOP family class I SAM-dependent RNA methyltransferase n=1 Tax=Kamptonema TaxID=1501433 RepID=UPI0001DAC18B|nr:MULTISPECIES: RsmB/NOP family class I SAM-dependent RNA methyltransferase [Kamptonema]CBN57867.1 Fmu (Sun)/nucleolar NOL1/Nop2p [Kamptonema sp. PCC 6506]
MEKPSNLLLKLTRNLFTDTTEQERFIQAIVNPQPFNPCILWLESKPIIHPFTVETPTTWQPEFVDRLAINTKPGKHQLHESGHYYCLDFSSIFAASLLLTISQPIKLILDMCAAPGGKSIFAWKILHPELLISNEVIGKRIGMLISNLKRCQISQSVVTSADSEKLAEIIPQTANLVIVDAPCTGQSLLAKGEKAPGCFHPVTINSNANRQKRILANSAKIVAPQGYLAYMTCTYSPAENEQVTEWFIAKFPQFQPVEVPDLAAHQSHLTTLHCYRMWPQDRLGAGAFTVLFQNQEEGRINQLSADFLDATRFKL